MMTTYLAIFLEQMHFLTIDDGPASAPIFIRTLLPHERAFLEPWLDI